METLAFSALPYYNKVTIKDHFIYCFGGNMQKLLEQITTEVAKAFEACEYSADFARVSISNRPDLCEYQCNGAMAGAKKYKKAPFMIAEDVAVYLKESSYFETVEVVKPSLRC